MSIHLSFLWDQWKLSSITKLVTQAVEKARHPIIPCNYDIDFLYYCDTYQVGHIYGESVDIIREELCKQVQNLNNKTKRHWAKKAMQFISIAKYI